MRSSSSSPGRVSRAGLPARQWGEMVNGRSLWWSMHGRNKRSVTVDLKTEGGKELILKLVAHCDVVIENFRPHQLERMGISPDVLRQPHPDHILAQITGYGPAGPGAPRAAFWGLGE